MNTIKDNWYIIYTKPRHEKKVAEQLDHFNLPNFLPTIRTLKVYQKKKKHITIPLFPSYVFVKLQDAQQYFQSLQIPGVLYYLKMGGQIEVINGELINKLRTILTKDHDDIEVSFEYLYPGCIMNIQSGPFAGFSCEIIQHKGKHKMLVRIELLRRNILVNISKEDLISCSHTKVLNRFVEYSAQS